MVWNPLHPLRPSMKMLIQETIMRFVPASAKLLGLLLAGCIVSGPAAAASVTVFSENFEGGTIPSQITGAGAVVGTQGFTSYGFGTNLLRNASTGNPAAATTLTLSGLQSHTGIDLNFLLGIINSWDGNGNPLPDYFNVRVDGVSIFKETFAADGINDSFVPQTGVALAENGSLFTVSGDNPNWRDAAYDMGLQTSVFDNIAHTGATLTIDFFASGGAWSGGADESFALDNIEVVLNGVPTVPEPASLALLGLGLAGLGFSRGKKA